MSWLLLIAAGVVEVAWALSLEPTQGFTRLGPTVVSLILMMGAVYLLTLAVRGRHAGGAVVPPRLRGERRPAAT